MSNGQMLTQLRSLASGETQIPQKAMLQLILAAQAETIEKVNHLEKIIVSNIEHVDAIDDRVCETERYIIEHENKISSPGLKRITDLEENVSIVTGSFIKNHPKIALAIAIAFVAITNVWLVSGFRKPILSFLTGLPEEMVP